LIDGNCIAGHSIAKMIASERVRVVGLREGGASSQTHRQHCEADTKKTAQITALHGHGSGSCLPTIGPALIAIALDGDYRSFATGTSAKVRIIGKVAAE
jgi:hypothetical protein